MDGTKSRQLKIALCGLATLGMFAATQGCSSSSTSGSGGSTGSGGSRPRRHTARAARRPARVARRVDAGPRAVHGHRAGRRADRRLHGRRRHPAAGHRADNLPGNRLDRADGQHRATVARDGSRGGPGSITAGTYAGSANPVRCVRGRVGLHRRQVQLTRHAGTCTMLKLGANFPQVETTSPSATRRLHRDRPATRRPGARVPVRHDVTVTFTVNERTVARIPTSWPPRRRTSSLASSSASTDPGRGRRWRNRRWTVGGCTGSTSRLTTYVPLNKRGKPSSSVSPAGCRATDCLPGYVRGRGPLRPG